MPMTIPKIRKRLTEIAQGIGGFAAEVEALAEETKRRPATRRAPVKQMPIPPEVRRKVRLFVKANPTMHYAEIAPMFGLKNAGRVSEIMRGFRDKN
jgi:hypothetical protein